MPDELTIIIFVKEGPNGVYTDVSVSKPQGMKDAEVIGRLEQAKNDILNGGIVKEHGIQA